MGWGCEIIKEFMKKMGKDDISDWDNRPSRIDFEGTAAASSSSGGGYEVTQIKEFLISQSIFRIIHRRRRHMMQQSFPSISLRTGSTVLGFVSFPFLVDSRKNLRSRCNRGPHHYTVQ